MNLTSDGKRMLDWAKNNNSPEIRKTVFAPMDESVSSYYEKRQESDSLIYEYVFDDFPQIKAFLEDMWQDEPVMKEMVLISAVSAMKHKPAEEGEEMELKSVVSGALDGEFEIPEYVYVF